MLAPQPRHLGLVQQLGFGFAGPGDLLIPGSDLGDEVSEVQAAVVVHGQHHGHVTGLGLQLAQLLQGGPTQCPMASRLPFPLEPRGKWEECLTSCSPLQRQPSFMPAGTEHALSSYLEVRAVQGLLDVKGTCPRFQITRPTSLPDLLSHPLPVSPCISSKTSRLLAPSARESLKPPPTMWLTSSPLSDLCSNFIF